MSLCALLGCGGSEESGDSIPTPPSDCSPGNELRDDGTCVAAGVDVCAQGFLATQDGGCEALLPVSPCGLGTLAVPGDESCHTPMPCGATPWGDIPIEASAQFVDAAFAGTSDGTQTAPWQTVQAAIDAAAPGAIVAVAAGTYVESVTVESKPVRLYGRCPELVSLQGVTGLAAVQILRGASGTELHDLSISGAVAGIAASGSQNLLVSGAWIHDTASRGIVVQDDLDPTDMVVQDSLVEMVTDIGVFVGGASLVLERTTIRDTQPRAGGTFGDGMSIEINGVTGTPGSAEVVQSLIERNHDAGIFVIGSSATVRDTVVRDNLPQPADDDYGRGISVQNDLVSGVRATLALSGSVVSGNRDIGLFLMGSDATIDTTVVRDTLPNLATNLHGRGVNLQSFEGVSPGAYALISRCLVANNYEHGVIAFGSDLELVATRVAGTKERIAAPLHGRGLTVQSHPVHGQPSTASVRDCAFEGNAEVGIVVTDSQSTIEHVDVSRTMTTSDGSFGDGIAAVDLTGGITSVTVSRSAVRENSRAGLLCFGATTNLRATELECNTIDIDRESNDIGVSCNLGDEGENVCGCNGSTVECQAVSTSLAPPPPVE